MNLKDIQNHLGQPVFVGTPYKGQYIGTLEAIHAGEDGKPWRGEIRVTGIVKPPPLHRGCDGLPAEKTQGYSIGEVIDAGALLIAAPPPPDIAAFAHASLEDALRREVVLWKTVLLDVVRMPDRHHEGAGPTRFEYTQACLDRRIKQLESVAKNGPGAMRFGRAIRGAVSKSQIKRYATLAFDDLDMAPEESAPTAYQAPQKAPDVSTGSPFVEMAAGMPEAPLNASPATPLDRAQDETPLAGTPETKTPTEAPVLPLQTEPDPAPASARSPQKTQTAQKPKPLPKPLPKPKSVQSSLF